VEWGESTINHAGRQPDLLCKGNSVNGSLAVVPRLLAAAFGALSIACFVLNALCVVVAASPAGEQLLLRGNLVRLSRGRLAAANAADTEEFDRLLGLAADKARCGDRWPGKNPLLRYIDSEGCSVVQIVLLGEAFAPSNPAFLVLVDALPSVAAGNLARGWNLTTAEAAVAAELLRGTGSQQISRNRGVSHETVRTQIKNIYAKLGIRKRSELLALANGFRGACPSDALRIPVPTGLLNGRGRNTDLQPASWPDENRSG
jgi:DNA-binding CsgD family transcriptional regulator